MKTIAKMVLTSGAALLMVACNGTREEAATNDFKYTIDSFADLKVMRYRIP